MKRLLVLVFALAVANPAHAFLGVGDITFDPTSYTQLTKQYQQAVELYNNAKKQLDGLVSIEKTIKDAQMAYETLASTNLKTIASGFSLNSGDNKTAAGLRAQLAGMENGTTQTAGYISYQLSQLNQLENLALLQKATASNLKQSSGKINPSEAASITAQSSSTIAALAAVEAQRRQQEDIAKTAAAQAEINNLDNAKTVYKAMGQ
jgi:chaperonin cofactor prefoldin